MSNAELNAALNQNYQKILPTVTETLQQLFMRDFSIDISSSEDDNMAVALAGEKFPSLAVTMKTSGQSEIYHLFLVEPAMTLKLYAWMIGDDPEEAVSDAHIEGLNEAAIQICSQISIMMDGEGTPVSIDDINLEFNETSASILENMPGDDGVQGNYTIGIDEESFGISHYLWKTGEGQAMSNGGADPSDNVNVSKAEFENFMTSPKGESDPESMDLLLDVELEVVAELGRKIFPI